MIELITIYNVILINFILFLTFVRGIVNCTIFTIKRSRLKRPLKQNGGRYLLTKTILLQYLIINIESNKKNLIFFSASHVGLTRFHRRQPNRVPPLLSTAISLSSLQIRFSRLTGKA
jgi:hypothetical protein